MRINVSGMYNAVIVVRLIGTFGLVIIVVLDIAVFTRYTCGQLLLSCYPRAWKMMVLSGYNPSDVCNCSLAKFRVDRT